jgi:glycosyltransferase involved in cell wall biosynthesis
VKGFDSVQNKWLLKLKEWFYVYRARKVLPPSDILVTHTFWAPLMLDPQQYGKIYVHVGRYPKGQFKFYGKASRFQVPTIAIKEAVKKEIPDRDREISVLPYPLEWDVKSYANYETRSKRILYLGRLHPEKGVLELVNSFRDVSEKLPSEWRLRVRGPLED